MREPKETVRTDALETDRKVEEISGDRADR
jgi:hypothetical protein